ncbi:MAG: septal ring lytic transglycosylase RlpA family protein [Candidatus Adiutrix sp.]|nr:septal ring lytic transglycosylase RlpA family protein [Candidatus Adiutrix sp.]
MLTCTKNILTRRVFAAKLAVAPRVFLTLALALGLAFSLSACGYVPKRPGSGPAKTGSQQAFPGKGYHQQGEASWYGKELHGNRTASGERFNMNDMTAAHRTLPFGTWARVRNVANGREVAVRINDRGPVSKKRIIDLSRAAARKIGIDGIGQVDVTAVPEAEARKVLKSR